MKPIVQLIKMGQTVPAHQQQGYHFVVNWVTLYYQKYQQLPDQTTLQNVNHPQQQGATIAKQNVGKIKC